MLSHSKRILQIILQDGVFYTFLLYISDLIFSLNPITPSWSSALAAWGFKWLSLSSQFYVELIKTAVFYRALTVIAKIPDTG